MQEIRLIRIPVVINEPRSEREEQKDEVMKDQKDDVFDLLDDDESVNLILGLTKKKQMVIKIPMPPKE